MTFNSLKLVYKCDERRPRTGVHYSLNEVFARNQTVVVLVHLPEEIRQPGLLVVHEFQELVMG